MVIRESTVITLNTSPKRVPNKDFIKASQDSHRPSTNLGCVKLFLCSLCFLQFATHSYVCLLCMRLCGLTEFSGLPSTFPVYGTLRDKQDFVRRLSLKVVDFVWLKPDGVDKVSKASDVSTSSLEYCLCSGGTALPDRVVLSKLCYRVDVSAHLVSFSCCVHADVHLIALNF